MVHHNIDSDASGLGLFPTHFRTFGPCRASVTSALCLESHFLQNRFDPRQSLVTFNRKAEGLILQLIMLGVQEGDDRPRRAEVAPCTSKNIALSPCLFRREPCGISVPAKNLGSTATLIGPGMVNGGGIQVTDPGSEPGAPSASRAKRIWSAYSRAN